MKNLKELEDYQDYIHDKYPDYKHSVNAAQEIISHPDYSHITVAQSWEDNRVYFHVEKSPTHVLWAFTFPKEMVKHLVSPLDLAINNKY